MEVKARDIEDILLVSVEGRIDFSNTKDFEDSLFSALSDVMENQGKALLDMGGVSYMSSSGLRVLMLAAKQFNQKGSEIYIAALQPLLREVFKISRFDMVFQVYPTIAEALENISTSAAAVFNGE